jgi:hypothetical protein
LLALRASAAAATPCARDGPRPKIAVDKGAAFARACASVTGHPAS